jgi:hypothetical protein
VGTASIWLAFYLLGMVQGMGYTPITAFGHLEQHSKRTRQTSLVEGDSRRKRGNAIAAPQTTKDNEDNHRMPGVCTMTGKAHSISRFPSLCDDTQPRHFFTIL